MIGVVYRDSGYRVWRINDGVTLTAIAPARRPHLIRWKLKIQISGIVALAGIHIDRHDARRLLGAGGLL